MQNHCRHALLASLESLDDSVAGRGNREHSKVMIKCVIVGFHTSCSRPILKRIHFVTVLIASSHGALNATVGQKASNYNVVNVALPQQEIKVGGMKTTKATFSFHNFITSLGLHSFTELRAPFTCCKCFTFFDPSQYSIGCASNFVVTL
jgi:hypothetical protein